MEGAQVDLKRAVVEGDLYGPSDEWTDKVECVPLALAALLVMFVEDEHSGLEKFEQHIEWRIAEYKNTDKCMRPNDLMWISYEVKVAQLYRWWTEDRPKLMQREQELLHAWSVAKHGDNDLEPGESEEDFAKDLEARLNAPDTPRSRELFQAHTDLKERIRKEMQEFCLGVVEVRESLWT